METGACIASSSMW